ncbi:MAG: glycosyltransferase family 4 protein [Lachnospiraceae bacterium]|nr:glycosyltransferase family 4 protein [Lachnospiraceae bacterium]
MNILIVHNYYRIPGGEDVVVRNESVLLEEAGHKVFLYTRHNKELNDMRLSEKLTLPVSVIYSRRTYNEISRLIKDNSIDIIMVHNTLMLISPSVYYAAVELGVPVIQTIHNFRLLCPAATFYRKGHICEDCLHKGLGCAVLNRCYRDSFVFTLACVLSMKYHRRRRIYGRINYICLTGFGKEKLLLLQGVKEERVFIKPNYTKTERDFVPYGERELSFVYAGRLDESKGVKEILYAWENMGETAPLLYLCGTGPLTGWCKGYIREKGLKQVIFKGFLEHDEMLGLVANAKALLLPSKWYEGLPMTMIEAFSVGTPVIGSDLGNVGSALEEGLGVRIDMDRGAEAVKEAVALFIQKPGRFVYDESVFRSAAKRYGDKENIKILNRIFDIVSKQG